MTYPVLSRAQAINIRRRGESVGGSHGLDADLPIGYDLLCAWDERAILTPVPRVSWQAGEADLGRPRISDRIRGRGGLGRGGEKDDRR